MTEQKIREIISLYKSHLENRGVLKIPFSELQEKYYLTGIMLLCHCYWMLDQIEQFLNQDEKKLDKAFRWLGFIQGVLCSQQHFSIKELRDHSRSS